VVPSPVFFEHAPNVTTRAIAPPAAATTRGLMKYPLHPCAVRFVGARTADVPRIVRKKTYELCNSCR